MNTTTPTEIRTQLADAVRTVAPGGQRDIKANGRHWRITRNPHDGTVIVFERKLGKRFTRWYDSDVRDLLAEG
jgi:hypothetical protein